MRVTQYRTDITITNLASSYLPVPFPAVAVDGLDGVWRAVPYSRTVLSGQTGAQGQDYEVVSQVPRPSAEQIRAADAAVDEVAIDVLSLPEDMPQIIGDLAHEVPADADTDYDRLIALQSWFRGPQFTYSLTAPVAAGFDDSGSEAVAAFLEVKEGYCVHFAGAFVLMARSLGMPSRIVVGFLPGSYTGQVENGQRIAEVKTSQLHAWPEVHFEGIGWVAFEPTKSLGTATRFLPQNQAIDEGGEDISGPTPTATASPRPTAAPAERPDDGPTDATGTATPMIDLRPYLTGVAIALILVSAPFLLRTLRRRMLARRAGAGDVVVAWRMVQEAAIDLGVPVPASESPRAFGTRLIAAHSAPVAEVSRLVAAIERASYAPPGSTVPRPSGSGASNGDGGMAADAESIRTGMLAALAHGARAQALILPRSLLIRPGSALASPAPATAR
jgi:transglutaminase-like putative cysteine protease